MLLKTFKKSQRKYMYDFYLIARADLAKLALDAWPSNKITVLQAKIVNKI